MNKKKIEEKQLKRRYIISVISDVLGTICGITVLFCIAVLGVLAVIAALKAITLMFGL